MVNASVLSLCIAARLLLLPSASRLSGVSFPPAAGWNRICGGIKRAYAATRSRQDPIARSGVSQEMSKQLLSRVGPDKRARSVCADIELMVSVHHMSS
jgi:hypothetical protein